MSVPRCPQCRASVPMRGSFSTTTKSPLSRTCTSCGEDLPDYLFGDSAPVPPRRRSRTEKINRMLRG